MSQIEVESIYRQSIGCNSCFENPVFKVERGLIKTAQPRWIGRDYFSSRLKICVIAINPGNVGRGISDISSAEKFQKRILDFEQKKGTWEEVMSFIEGDMENWGKGRYEKFYFEKMKLEVNEVALMNMMLCSATPPGQRKNKYTKQTLKNCFKKNTKKLICALEPEVIILSGKLVQSEMKALALPSVLPNSEIIDSFHYRPQNQNDWDRVDEDAERIGQYLKELKSNYEQ